MAIDGTQPIAMRKAIGAVVVVLAVGAIVWLTRDRKAKVEAGTSAQPVAAAPGGPGGKSAPPFVVKSSPAAPAEKTAANVVVSGGWGSQPGEFGRRRDPESNPEGPMAVVAGARGEVDVIDQINRRVQRFRDGKLIGTVSMGGDTVQDATHGKDGRLLLLDRLADRNVQVYGPDGKLENEVGIVGKGIPEGGGVTGVFSDDSGIYVEREHGSVVRIADANGTADPNRPELVGRPSRDGRLLLQAQIADRAAGVVTVRAVDRASNQPAWSQPVQFDAPILHVVTLDSDRHGMTYLAVDVGREQTTAPYGIYDEKIVIVRLGAGGVPRGSIEVPPISSADESFRPITVDDDGVVYVMYGGEKGLSVQRFVFP